MENDNTNNSYLYAFVIFLLLLFLTAIVIAAIILFLPRSNVALFGACTEQSECESGLICYKANSNTGTVGKCLGGLGYTCNNNSDCANNLICLENSSSLTKMCSLPLTLGLQNGQVNVQPVISLVLPTNLTALQPCTTYVPPCAIPTTIPTTNINTSPQALLNKIFPTYNQPSSVSYQSSSNNGSFNAYRTFTPMNISIAKKKL